MRTAQVTHRSAKSAPHNPVAVLNPTTFLTLSSPPSVNALYKNLPGRGRAKTKPYKEWLAIAGRELQAQAPGKVAGRHVIVINIERGSAASDIDNRLKALSDLLVSSGVIDDDRFTTAIAVCWSAKADGLCRVVVTQATSMNLDLIVAPDGASGGFFLRAPEQEGPANDGD